MLRRLRREDDETDNIQWDFAAIPAFCTRKARKRTAVAILQPPACLRDRGSGADEKALRPNFSTVRAPAPNKTMQRGDPMDGRMPPPSASYATRKRPAGGPGPAAPAGGPGPSVQVASAGRSLKRLRLDTGATLHVNLGCQQSVGTLSVGNDSFDNCEYAGDDDDAYYGGEDGSGRSSGEGGGSWVASLGSSHKFGGGRRRMPMAGGGPGGHADGGDVPHGSSGMAGRYGHHHQGDDATVGTTNALAPRRRRRYTSTSGGQRRRATFLLDGQGAAHPPASSQQQQQQQQQRGASSDLEIEDLEVSSILAVADQRQQQAQQAWRRGPPHHRGEAPRAPGGDPLLIAARHAARPPHDVAPPDHPPAAAAAAGLSRPQSTVALHMSDCCSSVTEEETSLAEDEASISAISIGANTTLSAITTEAGAHPQGHGRGMEEDPRRDRGARRPPSRCRGTGRSTRSWAGCTGSASSVWAPRRPGRGEGGPGREAVAGDGTTPPST